MELIRFIKVLWKRKWLILIVSLTAGILTFILTLFLPGVFRSEAQLATGITEDQAVSLDPNTAGSSYYDQQNKFSNLIENINSRQVMSLLSYRLILHDLTEKPFKNVQELTQEYPIETLKEARKLYQNKYDSIGILSTLNNKEQILISILKKLKYDYKSLKADIIVTRIPSTDYIKIMYDSENPLLSAFIVNSLCEEFLRYNLLIRSERSDYSVKFFAQLAGDKKKELDDKVNALKEFKAGNEVVNLKVQSESIIQQIKDLEVSREAERKRIIGLEQSIRSIENRLTGQELSYLERRASMVNERIYELKNRINNLNQQYISSGNQSLQNELESLRRQLQQEISNTSDDSYVTSSNVKQELINKKINQEVELDIAEASLVSINREIGRLRGNVSGFASKEAQISALEREISVAQNEYLSVLDKLNNARYTSRSIGNSLRQVEFGFPSDEPIRSGKLLMTGLATIIAFSFCISFIVVLEYIDLTPKNPAILTRLTELVPIGYLNEVKAKNIRLEQLYENHPKLEKYVELLRNIRYEIEASEAKSILFTSTKEGEGKTSLMLSLAYSLSLLQKKVLIIDTNFKRNSISKIFSAKPLLEKISSNPDEIEHIVTGTGFKGIYAIGCEGGGFSPEEIFSQVDFRKVVDKLLQKYDYVFLEGASLNKYADSKELMNYVEKMIIVFSAQEAIAQSDKSTIEYIHSLGDNLLGVVLNKVDLDTLI